MADAANLTLSHYEIRVRDLPAMEKFYTRVLDFVVTDRRGAGDCGMVFLSRNANEHHQIVLSGDACRGDTRIDHFAFRMTDLDVLRAAHATLAAESGATVETVSHGTSWSVYCRDPEGNRLEFIVDTPWHVDQPCRFAIDLTKPNDELVAWTEEQIRHRPGFGPAGEWRGWLSSRLRS